MTGAWNPAGWRGWLGSARLATNLVIVAASVSVPRVLFGLNRILSRASPTAAPTVLVSFAALIALCAVSHLIVVLAGQSSSDAVTTALKVVTAALWVVAAVRFRAVVAHLTPPPSAADPCEDPGLADPCDHCVLVVLAMKTERLKIKARMLENMIRNETWLLDQTDALRELREVLADLEAHPCQI